MLISPNSGSLTLRSSQSQGMFLHSGTGVVDINATMNTTSMISSINMSTYGNLSLLQNSSKILMRESSINSSLIRTSLVNGNVTIISTLVTANTRVWCFPQSISNGLVGIYYLNGVASGKQFNISSTVIENSTIECHMIEAT